MFPSFTVPFPGVSSCAADQFLSILLRCILLCTIYCIATVFHMHLAPSPDPLTSVVLVNTDAVATVMENV